MAIGIHSFKLAVVENKVGSWVEDLKEFLAYTADDL